MRMRHILLCGLLAAAVLAPSLASANPYTDPFAPSVYCKAQHLSRHHVRGMERSPYSTCVRALTKMQAHHKGTPYARCVAAGGHLRRGR